MGGETVSLAILFADIADSTQIYEVLGNTTAKQIVDDCIALLAKVATRNSGTVVKTIGDEIMCTFETASDAIEAAIEMHLELDEVAFPNYGSPNIYVGIQFGSVIQEDNDVFGDAVNVAARMVELAKQRQIVTTEETIQQASPEHRAAAHWIDKTALKGKTGEVGIYELVWEQQDVTIMEDYDATVSVNDAPLQSTQYRLEVRFRTQLIVVDENRPIVTLGRQLHNDVVVQDDRVSRSHASIEYRWGKFILIDRSSNGTYVIAEDKEPIFLKRDEAQLVANGIIGLGNPVRPESDSAIHFAVRSTDSPPPPDAPEGSPTTRGLNNIPTKC